MGVSKHIQSVDDARYFANRRIPAALKQMLDSGTGEGVTAKENARVFRDVRLKPRAAVFNGSRDLATTVLGYPIDVPILTAPTGGAGLCHRDGEAGVARAAGAAGTIQVVSSMTTMPIERIAAAATGSLFYQLYFAGNQQAIEARIERARKAECKALVVTVDGDRWAPWEYPVRDRAGLPLNNSLSSLLRFAPQAMRRPAWLLDFLTGRISTGAPMILDSSGAPMTLGAAMGAISARSPTWSDMAWIRQAWKGPMIVKGILSADDARLAVEHGADAIVVSNHGGYTLDGVTPTLQALPAVVDAVGKQVEILFDGGIRRGSDVVKKLALGARAVLIGRAYVWGLAADGEAGVRQVIRLLNSGIDDTLGLLGCASVRGLDRSFVARMPEAVRAA